MSAPERSLSLDVLRGLVVITMIGVNSAAYLKYVGHTEAYGFLMHSEWAGFSLADAVFPAFVVLLGASVALVASRRGPSPDPKGQWGRIGRRVLGLGVWGLIISNIYFMADMAHNGFRPFGVLQRLALVYGGVSLAYLYLKPRSRLGLCLILLGLSYPLSLISPPGTPAVDLWQKGHNFYALVDRLVLGSHIYVKGPFGYDPEGILGTLNALAQGLMGAMAYDHVEKSRQGSGGVSKGAIVLGLWAIGLMISGGLIGYIIPIVKDMWSLSYVLLSTGLCLGLWALLILGLDRPSGHGTKLKAALAPLLWFGTNALFAYVLHELASLILVGDIFLKPYWAIVPFVGAEAAQILPIALFLALLAVPLRYLYQKRLHIRL